MSNMLRRFPAEDRADMIEGGEIKVTCEFCSTEYRFKPEEFG
jgi:molecular chaperone Hsp33